MKKYILLTTIILLGQSLIRAHCQVPCGIYDDSIRIIQIKEDFTTIKKAMIKIKELSTNSDALSKNQLYRWVNEKDKHASNIQNIITNYFLTQRIRETNSKYFEQVTSLQKLLVIAMKCKQSVDKENIEIGLKLVDLFSQAYFDSHGLEHLKEISK